MIEVVDLYPSQMMAKDEHVNSDDKRQERLRIHRAAVLRLKPILSSGDRIKATRAECGCKQQTYTFSHWDGDWIVSASGIDTLIPSSVTRINEIELKKD